MKVLTVIGAGLITAEVIGGGLGRHGYYLQPSQLRLFTALGWGDWIQTFITLMFTKISICLFLLRIVDGRKIRMGIYSLIGCLVLFTTIFTCLFLGICRPLKAHWNIGMEGVCLSDKMIENIVMAQGSMSAQFQVIDLIELILVVLSIVTDLICAAFPIFFLRGLQVKLRTKIALCVLMGLGVMSVPSNDLKTTD